MARSCLRLLIGSVRDCHISLLLAPLSGEVQQTRDYGKYFAKYKTEPPEYTTEPQEMVKLGGRDERGRRVSRYGGGVKVWRRMVDSVRRGPTSEEGGSLTERVELITKDVFYSAHIALVASGERKRWIYATESMRPGDAVNTTSYVPHVAVRAVDGDSWPIGALPLGSVVSCVERTPGGGGKVAMAAGTSALFTRRVGDTCYVRMPTGREMAIDKRCQVVVGRMSNIEHNKVHWGSMNARRHAGYKQRSGLFQKKGGRQGRKIRAMKPPVVYEAKTEPDES